MSKSTELTDGQIRDIIEQSKSSDWNIPLFVGLPISLTSVTKVSLETGLIFIGGDESIGVTHILNRHQGNIKPYTSASLSEMDLSLSLTCAFIIICIIINSF